LYALTHRGNPGDVEHYVELCHDAESVLELGSGSGRVLCALARSGREVWGLELDDGLLRLGRKAVAALPAATRRSVTLLRADMETFELPRRFQRVILPYNALYCLLSARRAERCLRAVHAALEPGGLFGFDVWSADRLHDEGLAPADEDEPVAQLEHAGRRWRVFERCERARAPQRLDVTYTYVPDGRAAPRSQVVRQRYYRSTELLELLTKCKFAVQSKLGTFGGLRFGSRSTRMVVTARALP